MHSIIKPVHLALFCVVLIAVAGCSQAAGVAPQPDSSAVPNTGPVPVFSGPWAQEFTQTYEDSSDPTVRAILDDGVITDQEYAETQDIFKNCMANLGFKVLFDNGIGGFSIPEPNASAERQQEMDDADRACSDPFSPVGGLLSQIKRNPDHLNEDEIVVACLKKNNLVEQGYTAKQYAADREANTLPYDPDSSNAALCLYSPLG